MVSSSGKNITNRHSVRPNQALSARISTGTQLRLISATTPPESVLLMPDTTQNSLNLNKISMMTRVGMLIRIVFNRNL